MVKYSLRIYPKAKLEAFYSDSLSDLPMMKLADKAYLVDGENVKEIDDKLKEINK